VAVQYGMKLIVDTMSAGDRNASAIWHWLTVFIGLIAAESLLWRVAGWLGCTTIVSTGVDMRLDLFRHLTGHPMGYFSNHFSGALGNRVTATAGASGSIFGTLTWKVVPPVVDFLGAIVVLVSIDARMAWALVLSVATVGWAVAGFGLRGRPLHQAFAPEGAKVGGELVDVISNIWTVKAFSAATREYRRLQQAFGREAGAQRASWLYLEKARVLHDLLLLMLAGGMLFWAVVSWRNGRSTTGDVVVVSALTFRILHGSRDLALAWVDAAQQFGVLSEMLSVIATSQPVVDEEDARTFQTRGGSIRLKDVEYAYAGGAPVLRGFDLHITAGQRCGIVGASGAGKSTLLGLVQRLDDVQAGSVEIDGQDVRSVGLDGLRSTIAVVPQDIGLLHRTVIENIRYGRPDASNEEVYEAARNACCDDFIANLPEGYETTVGERGVRLSGGQRQRIGIARAFLKRAPILLLDEATSALDSESELKIQQALERLVQRRTVVAVAHRLSTVAAFDRIVVIEHGPVVEDGSPNDLLCANGLYARLWKMQSEENRTT
jgi:ATP-binding cassette, subfamily B, bacterial